MADALEAARPRIVEVADRESALGEPRLNGELTRTCFQLRLFAEVLEEGSYVEATIDHAGPTPMGPRPDLRRMLVPLGPAAVFGASNFPLAFSVPGGDTASADSSAPNPACCSSPQARTATRSSRHSPSPSAPPPRARCGQFDHDALEGADLSLGVPQRIRDGQRQRKYT
jgi:hypothetical protein